MDRPVKFAETPILSPMGILVVENEALKMTIEDLERYLANCKSELVEARANISSWKQDRKRVQECEDMLHEVKFAIDGFDQEDDK